MTYEGPPQYPQQQWNPGPHPAQPPQWGPPYQPAPPNYPPPGYPYGPPQPPSGAQLPTIAAFAAILLAVVGTAMQLESVSLLTGDSIYWIGAALAVIGAGASFLSGRTWVRIVAIILAVLCVLNVIYAEKQLSDKRHEIQQIFTTPTG